MEVASGLRRLSRFERYNFEIASEGAQPALPKSSDLASADAFITYCDKYVALARKNTKDPIRRYFTPFRSANLNGLPEPKIAMHGQHQKLLHRQEEFRDYSRSLNYVKSNADQFANASASQIDAQLETLDQGLEEIETRLSVIRDKPYDPIGDPPEIQVALPKQNYLSIDQVHFRLTIGRAVRLKVLKKVDAVGAKQPALDPNLSYIVIFRTPDEWYGYTDDFNAPTGKTGGVLTKLKPKAAGELYLWRHKFLYDNHGKIFHAEQDVQGELELVDEKSGFKGT
jgi:hypothetical protein